MRRSKWDLLLVTVSLSALVLTGCWDRVEIEERGFVVAMGIDLVHHSEIEPKARTEIHERHGTEKRTRVKVTYQLALPGKLAMGASQEGNGGRAFVNFTTEGDTLFETARILSTRSSRSLYFEHNKLVLIGEELARSGEIDKFVDLLLRDHEMRRRMKVIVVRGEAKEALDVMCAQEKTTSEYLDSISENSRKTARMPKEMMIGDLSEKLIAQSCFILQRVVPHEKEVKMAGAGVFRGIDKKLIGWLGEEETEAVNWARGDIRRGITEAMLPTGELVVYEIRKANTKIIPRVKNGNIHFTVQIQSEGSLGESFSKRDALDPKFIEDVENAVEKEIRQSITYTIKKLQNELRTDVVGFGSELARKEPKIWEKMKHDWDYGKNYFQEATFDVQVQATVRFPGVITSLDGKK